MLIRTIAAATASALLAGGAVAYTATAADTHSTTATTSSAKQAKHGPPKTQGQKQAQRATRATARRARLAQSLGVTSAQLQAANDALSRRNLDARVAAGRLTAAERDALVACRAAPLTCDRTNVPARGGAKAAARKAARRKQHAGQLQTRRAKALAGELHLDQAKVLAALKAQRKAQQQTG
jgi:hypothetical protein